MEKTGTLKRAAAWIAIALPTTSIVVVVSSLVLFWNKFAAQPLGITVRVLLVAAVALTAAAVPPMIFSAVGFAFLISRIDLVRSSRILSVASLALLSSALPVAYWVFAPQSSSDAILGSILYSFFGLFLAGLVLQLTPLRHDFSRF